MSPKPVYVLILVGGIAWLWWYPLQLYQAVSGFSWSQGAFVGADGKSQIFAFSIAGGAISFALMTFWIMKVEGKNWKNLLAAAAVAYICTISVTMWY